MLQAVYKKRKACERCEEERLSEIVETYMPPLLQKIKVKVRDIFYLSWNRMPYTRYTLSALKQMLQLSSALDESGTNGDRTI
jgi:hypothetical protein